MTWPASAGASILSAAVREFARPMFHFTALPPLSLYVHLPWCVRKCPYCDFNSHEARDAVPERAYIDALIKALEQELPSIWGRPIETVYLGGGTPSLFSPDSIERLLSQLRALLNLSATAEVTMEANPGTLETDRFAAFRAAGINRLSIGVQSFNGAMLQRLGRIHGAREAIAAVENAHAAGFEEINLDLMFGLPGQSVAEALADIEQAIALQPTHISHYQLTSGPTSTSLMRRRACPTRMSRGRCSNAVRRVLPSRVMRNTRSPLTRARDIAAGTISTIGCSATPSASAPVRTASSAAPIRTASSAAPNCVIRANTWKRRQRSRASQVRTP